MPRIFAGFFCHLFLSMHLENGETVYRQNNKNNDTLSGLERPIMSQEIELKLTISDDSIDAFLSSNVLSNYTPDVFMLENTYFDTSSQMLTKMGAALRLRKTPDEMVQTLKLRGRNVGGLHQREEWELPVSGDELEPDLFPEGALPKEIDLSELKPLFTTHFERTRWLVSYRQSTIELVLDRGQVRAGNEVDDILELELELKHGEVEDIFGLAIEISKEVAVMPSDISKAERGYRLCNRSQDASVALPVIVPQQSMESAFSALLGYEIEQLHRYWQVFWSTQQWRHLQSFLQVLGNMETEIDCFHGLMNEKQRAYATDHIQWISQSVNSILSWWPACFALSQDADKDPQSIAISLQQAKAKKALVAVQAFKANPELGFRMLSLTAWLHGRLWRDGQTQRNIELSEQCITDGVDYCFGKALNDLKLDCFDGSASHALSQSPVVHRLLMLCRYFDRLYGQEMGRMKLPLQELDDNLSRLSAMEVVAKLKDWINDLPFEQKASIHSWTRSQTVLLRDIKQLANKLMSGQSAIGGGVI